jgi:hypothetical protein
MGRPARIHGGANVADSLEAVAYEQAILTVGRQEAVLDGLRSRAGTLISAASLATSFLATLGIRGHSLSGLAWLAVGLFLAMGVCAGLVLWPWGDFFLGMDPYKVVSDYVDDENRLSVDEMKRDLAVHFGTNLLANDRLVRRLTLAFEAAAVLLFAEVVVWVVVLAAL